MELTFKTLSAGELRTEPGRSLYIDIIGNLAQVQERFGALRRRLEQALSSDQPVEVSEMPIPYRMASPGAVRDKLAELRGDHLGFAIAQFDREHRGEESVWLLEGIARYYRRAGIAVPAPGLLQIDGFGTVEFDRAAVIRSAPDPDLVGKNALQLAAAFIEQDFALVLERDGKLLYGFDCCAYEKTPKHVESGANNFMGQEFFEWHRRIPNWGHFLAATFEALDQAMRRRLVDELHVDLYGRNLYSDGRLVVRRFERDYVRPLYNAADRYVGFATFADNFMVEPDESRRPFDGAPFLRLDSPEEFHARFPVVKPFRHHPHGMRRPDGTELPAPGIPGRTSQELPSAGAAHRPDRV